MKKAFPVQFGESFGFIFEYQDGITTSSALLLILSRS